MGSVITARFSEELVKKLDKAVLRGHFQSRSDALRSIVEEHLTNHPELFLGEGAKKLLTDAPILSDDELKRLGSELFKGVSVAELVAEGRR